FGFGGTNYHLVVEEHIPGMLTSRTTTVQVPGAGSAVSDSGNGTDSRATSAAGRLDASRYAKQMGVAAVPIKSTESTGSGASTVPPPHVSAEFPARPGAAVAVVATATERPRPLGNVLAIGAADVASLRAKVVQHLDGAKAGVLPASEAPNATVLAQRERLVVSFDDPATLVKRLESALGAVDKEDPRAWRLLQTKGVFRGQSQASKVVFLFPGQGSQYVNMLSRLREIEPVVAETFAEADEVMTPLLGRPLTSFLFVDARDPAELARAEDALRDTTVCQPAVLSCDVALSRVLAKHGIVPDMVMGHSLGEWAAVVASGMLPFRDALVVVSARARGMASVSLSDPGKMASVLGPYDEIARRLGEIDGYVVAANLNARNQTVIAGDSATVVRAVEYFGQAGFSAQLIPVSHAFHSRIVAPASSVMREVLSTMPLRGPTIPVIGNVDGNIYPSEMVAVRDVLSRQLASPVQWVKSLETAYREGARVFVEVGPKRVLTGFAENVLGDQAGVVCLWTNHPKRGDVGSLHEAMCGLYAAGLPRPATVVEPTNTTNRAYEPSPARASAGTANATGTANAANAAGTAGTALPTYNGELPYAGVASHNSPPDYLALGRLFAKLIEDGLAAYGGRRAEQGLSVAPAAVGSVVVSGAGLGLPGQSGRVFDDANVERILRGDSFIEPVPEKMRELMLEKNVVRLVKREIGEPSLDPIRNTSEVLRLAAR
ncbi:MAG: acyltransferase domain-containing protein, partial [Pseudomonadota bacterium]